MNILRSVSIIIFILSVVIYGLYFAFVGFSNPELTQTQLILKTWPGLIVILSTLALIAIFECEARD